MITVQERIKQVVFKRVRELNGNNTEEDLSMVITEKLVADKFNLKELSKNIQIVNGEPDEGKIEPLGAWVYRDGSVENWLFQKLDTIAEAIRLAIKNKGAIVLCNGEEVKFDVVSDELAYYIENGTGKIKVVSI
jgi:hypothetical protein